jgi:hypothetical protein
MKRIGVDQVARALVRFGIVLVSVAAALILLQATPLWAQTANVTCTSATGLPCASETWFQTDDDMNSASL